MHRGPRRAGPRRARGGPMSDRRLLYASLALLVAVLFAFVPASAGASASGSMPRCASALPAASLRAGWACLESYTSHGVTYRYGSRGFATHLPPGSTLATAGGVVTRRVAS